MSRKLVRTMATFTLAVALVTPALLDPTWDWLARLWPFAAATTAADDPDGPGPGGTPDTPVPGSTTDDDKGFTIDPNG